MTMPAPMSAPPVTTSVRRIPAPAARAWSHEPVAQVTAAADRARPPSVTLPPRTSTTLSGTNASVPKNANVIANIPTATDGRPGRRRRLPGGSRCRRRRRPSQPPADGQDERRERRADGQRGQHQRRADGQAHGVACALSIAAIRLGRPLAGPSRASCG